MKKKPSEWASGRRHPNSRRKPSSDDGSGWQRDASLGVGVALSSDGERKVGPEDKEELKGGRGKRGGDNIPGSATRTNTRLSLFPPSSPSRHKVLLESRIRRAKMENVSAHELSQILRKASLLWAIPVSLAHPNTRIRSTVSFERASELTFPAPQFFPCRSSGE